MFKSETSDTDLAAMARLYGLHLNGIYFTTSLSNKQPHVGSYILNMTPPSAKAGHWIGLYISPNHQVAYFDSFGLPPNIDVETFIYKIAPEYIYNSDDIQNTHSGGCGQFVIDFLRWMTNHKHLDITNAYKLFIRHFLADSRGNQGILRRDLSL